MKYSGTLSVCLIVKDEERVLWRCLSAAVQIADDVIYPDDVQKLISLKEQLTLETDAVFITYRNYGFLSDLGIRDRIHRRNIACLCEGDIHEAIPVRDGWNLMICMDLEINDGTRLPLNGNTQRALCAQISRFIRRLFVEDITFPEQIKAGDDRYFAEEMLTHDPRTVYSGVMAYHYNYPREGSLFDLQTKGLISQTTVSQNPRPEQV